MLRAHPSKITPCLRVLRGDARVATFGNLWEAEQGFLEAYVKLSQVPKEFLKALLPELEPTKFGSADVCEKLERGATGTLYPLF